MLTCIPFLSVFLIRKLIDKLDVFVTVFRFESLLLASVIFLYFKIWTVFGFFQP